MGESRAFSVYAKLPVPLQNVACTLAGIRIRRSRYNATFRDASRLLSASEWWSLEEQREHQNERLRDGIRHAYNTVPYYREVFEARKLVPDDITTADDLPKLPILTKDLIRERWDDLQSVGWPRKRIVYSKTGGTTGKAMKLAEDVDTNPWQWAVWWRHRRRFGLELNDPFVVFAGRDVVPLSNLDPPIWRRNLAMRQTYVSIAHLTKPNMPVLVDYLQQRRVVYYSGYPSALYLLATWMLDNGVTLDHPPRMTVTGAETLLPHQRRVIEEALETRVSDQYGASEHCANISECEHGVYHVDMEFGVVEFLPLSGPDPSVSNAASSGPGDPPPNQHRIICTSLHNPVMPLIRYDIGDVATISDVECACGRQAPTVDRIDGRIESYIVTPDGRQHGRLDFLFKTSHRIEEAQLIQDTAEHLTIKVVRSSGYTETDERSLRADVESYLGTELQVDLDYVDQIPREPNGKFRQIVSKVFRDRYAPEAQK